MICKVCCKKIPTSSEIYCYRDGKYCSIGCLENHVVDDSNKDIGNIINRDFPFRRKIFISNERKHDPYCMNVIQLPEYNVRKPSKSDVSDSSSQPQPQGQTKPSQPQPRPQQPREPSETDSESPNCIPDFFDLNVSLW